MAKSADESTKKELPGVALEKAVARVQQMMDQNSVVTHNEKLTDRLGNIRQYDVVIRGTFGGKVMLGVVECRDKTSRIGPDEVDAFAKKCENLGANLRMMVSKNGFTAQALVVARHEFISCLSLMSSDSQGGLMIGQYCYGVIRRWSNVYLELTFAGIRPLGHWSYDDLLWQKKPIMNWFLNELFTTHYRDREPGKYRLSLVFPIEMTIEINGTEYKATQIGCLGKLVETKKRRWISWIGEGYYDWENSQIQIPAGAPLVSTGIEIDLSLWEDFEGELPTTSTDKELLLLFYGGQALSKDAAIPDLMSLGPIRTIAPVG
jgi:hypothetical protein